MFNKFSILVALAMAVAVAATAVPKTTAEVLPFKVEYDGNDLFLGERKPGDYQVTQFGVWGTAVEGEVVTKTLRIPPGYEITYIHAYDKGEGKSSGAIPTYVSGGPTEDYVEILFTSQPGKGILFWVDVWVRR